MFIVAGGGGVRERAVLGPFSLSLVSCFFCFWFYLEFVDFFFPYSFLLSFCWWEEVEWQSGVGDFPTNVTSGISTI